MPLVRIDVNEERSERELRAIGDAIHEALVTTCAVSADDRFQVFTDHASKTRHSTRTARRVATA